jgi:nitric oxide synthase-interacting protein
MGRHSKNAGGMGSESLTHAERTALGYGTAVERLGKDSIKDFDACALCLHPVRDPVVTPEGVLYEREAILEALLAQKKELARRAAAYEAERAAEARAAEGASREGDAARLAAFHSLNHGGDAPAAPAAAGGAALNAFWLPCKTPEAAAKAEKPGSDTLCPATGKRLRLKDLAPVRFTRTPGVEEGSPGRFMCPLCREAFTNVSRVVVLRPTGTAMGEDCYRRFVEPDGAFEGTKVRPKNVVRLQRGGTGFTATSEVQASVYTLLGVGSGLADNRGQHAAGRSRFAGMGGK